MSHVDCADPAASADSFNRWCLRALHQSCNSMLDHSQHLQADEQPVDYSCHQGPPPLRYSCIAPHCLEWVVSADSTGHCGYLKRLSGG